jgi:SulP family sulfate permease
LVLQILLIKYHNKFKIIVLTILKIALCRSIAFLAGIIMFSLGLFKFGFLVNFLSKPVLSGYTSASALIIAISQLKFFFGVPATNSPLLHVLVGEVFSHLPDTNGYAFLFGSVSLLVLLMFKNVRILKKIPKTNVPFPAIFMVVVISTLIGWGAKVGEIYL